MSFFHWGMIYSKENDLKAYALCLFSHWGIAHFKKKTTYRLMLCFFSSLWVEVKGAHRRGIFSHFVYVYLTSDTVT
jgi:hypothetical protein